MTKQWIYLLEFYMHARRLLDQSYERPVRSESFKLWSKNKFTTVKSIIFFFYLQLTEWSKWIVCLFVLFVSLVLLFAIFKTITSQNDQTSRLNILILCFYSFHIYFMKHFFLVYDRKYLYNKIIFVELDLNHLAKHYTDFI